MDNSIKDFIEDLVSNDFQEDFVHKRLTGFGVYRIKYNGKYTVIYADPYYMVRLKHKYILESLYLYEGKYTWIIKSIRLFRKFIDNLIF